MTADHDRVDLQTEFLISKVSGNPVAMLLLARSLLVPRGQLDRARALCKAALELAPDDGEVKALSQIIDSRDVGQWYFTMVQDDPRHALYDQALRRVVTPGSTVLDIGAGTGLFAMIAARAGAEKVIACERDPAVAEGARAVIEANGYADRVEIIAKSSKELEIGVDLEKPADVLLWDNLSNDLVSQNAIETIDDARRRLLRPGAAIIPATCEMRVALAEANPASDLQMGVVDGFDMTPFNRFRPTQVTISRSKFERRSEAVTIYDFDFFSTISPARNLVTVTAKGGRVDGVAQWLRFKLADDVFYDTGDDSGVTAFGVQYNAVEPFECEPGQPITIGGAHDRLRTWFWIDRATG